MANIIFQLPNLVESEMFYHDPASGWHPAAKWLKFENLFENLLQIYRNYQLKYFQCRILYNYEFSFLIDNPDRFLLYIQQLLWI